MIVLDTHIWIWWVHGDERLTQRQMEIIQAHEDDEIGVSAEDWFDLALSYPGIRLIELTPAIAIESTRLPGEFHRDPADQIIVATARIHGCPLVTSDSRILEYSRVETVG